MRKRAAALIGVFVLLAGCGGSTAGSAVAGERWDPCSITPDVIAATDLNPDYRDEGWGEGIHVDDWARCSFRPDGVDVPYTLSVKSSFQHTVDEERSDVSNIDGRNLNIDGRDSFLYKTDVAQSIEDCNIAIDVPPGVVVFSVIYRNREDGIDPCVVVQEHVSELEQYLPPTRK
ncbi:DUF3558 domain-containing protein [Rhodococcoides yunnanense]|uniref:DUF3558 domain-containing protein n=1 Tax=Rhodococcoides yunnanense TaxID=278209 RepID=UPI001FE98681|nr:DUF3558 domain-containing protein [Rhodococcus yunnanensis]